ncbi:TIR domain-containing protein [Arthrobacter rhombi]|uniref:TIR domain-containing protein n=1 Tax=Arthrobacter rhombi TaxID=71253 RepID=UPI003FCF07C0
MDPLITGAPNNNTIGQKLADPMAAFWEDGDGPSHSLIDRRFKMAGLAIPEGSKTTKVFNAFHSANNEQALDLLEGLLELLRKYSSQELRESSSSKVLRATIESFGISVSEEFQIDVHTAVTATSDAEAFWSETANRLLTPDQDNTPSWENSIPSPSFTEKEHLEIIAAERSVVPPKDIFLVHGHDSGALGEVERFVRSETGVNPIILSEQTNGGRTLIEKFEHYTTNAAYAIIIMTPDDVGRAVKDQNELETPRARENVIFEMGYFYGLLGRDHVSVLSFGAKLPGDVVGLVYIGREQWKHELAKELAHAGFKLDR